MKANSAVEQMVDPAVQAEVEGTLGIGILTDEERDRLVAMFLYGRKEDGEDETPAAVVESVVTWAEMVRVSAGMLDNVLNGSMMPVLDADGEIAFRMTPKGESEVEGMLAGVIAGGKNASAS